MDKKSNEENNEFPSGSISNEEKYYEMEDEATKKKEENLNIDLNDPKIKEINTRDELNELPDIQINETTMINTLKEPVAVTINRDISLIGHKLRLALIPRFSFLGTKDEEKMKRLRQWDLWGPMFICILLSFTLTLSTSYDGAELFLAVLLTIVLGAVVVTANAKLLGGNPSLLENVGVLGYCLFPICISTLIIALFSTIIIFWGRMLICLIGFLWSSLSSLSFMRGLVPDEKQFLGIYPILLFYLFASWFALTI